MEQQQQQQQELNCNSNIKWLVHLNALSTSLFLYTGICSIALQLLFFVKITNHSFPLETRETIEEFKKQFYIWSFLFFIWFCLCKLLVNFSNFASAINTLFACGLSIFAAPFNYFW